MLDPVIEPVTPIPGGDGRPHQLDGVGITPVDVVPVAVDPIELLLSTGMMAERAVDNPNAQSLPTVMRLNLFQPTLIDRLPRPRRLRDRFIDRTLRWPLDQTLRQPVDARLVQHHQPGAVLFDMLVGLGPRKQIAVRGQARFDAGWNGYDRHDRRSLLLFDLMGLTSYCATPDGRWPALSSSN